MTFLLQNIRASGVIMGLALLAMVPSGLHAQESSPGSDEPALLTGNDLVTVSLHADVARFQPGQRITLAVKYEIRPGWHLYWKNPGDNGMPPGLSVRVPPGVVVGAPLYPRPMIFQKSQGESIQTSFGYERSLCLLVPIAIPETFDAESLDLSIELEWFVCKDICLIGSERRVLSIPAALPQRPPTMDPVGLRLIRTWQGRMPLPAARARISATLRGDTLVVSGPAGRVRDVRFIPDLTPGVTPAVQIPVSAVVDGSKFTLEVPLDIRPQDALGQPLRAAGLVLMGSYARPRAISVDVPVSITSGDVSDSSGVETPPTQ
ncbi:MAG: hypothetical protein CMJ33_06900 [Phycisphaerae bacterium]|nr:hypothetical protein [Phycisphaerae bacterium]